MIQLDLLLTLVTTLPFSIPFPPSINFAVSYASTSAAMSVAEALSLDPVQLRSDDDRHKRAKEGVDVNVVYINGSGDVVSKTIRETCALLKLECTGFKLNLVVGIDPMHTIGGVIKDIFNCLAGKRMTEKLFKWERERNRCVLPFIPLYPKLLFIRAYFQILSNPNLYSSLTFLPTAPLQALP